jgi:hypothetical protein
MKVLVCGGRDYNDAEWINEQLDKFHETYRITLLIHGDARGADRLAGAWADSKQIPVLKFPADWKTYGKAAGAIRNMEMHDMSKPDAVIAFPGGRGTQHMSNYALDKGTPLFMIGGRVAQKRLFP